MSTDKRSIRAGDELWEVEAPDPKWPGRKIGVVTNQPQPGKKPIGAAGYAPLGMDDNGKLVYGGGVTGDMPARSFIYCEHGILEEQCVGCSQNKIEVQQNTIRQMRQHIDRCDTRLIHQERVIRRLDRGIDRLAERATRCGAVCSPDGSIEAPAPEERAVEAECIQCLKTWALKGDEDGEATDG